MSEIIPAILTDSFQDLQIKLDRLRDVSSWVQIDIMDGKFVPQKSIEIKDLIEVDSPLKVNFEIHLMVNDPLKYIEQCKSAKIKRVYFHIEPLKGKKEVDHVIGKIEEFGFEKGLALNPKTQVKKIEQYLSCIFKDITTTRNNWIIFTVNLL
mgnify:CR=1 FL=1